MKTQIKRMSPHQNGKVFGVLMAATSLVFLIPMLLVMFAAMPEMDQEMGFFAAVSVVMFVVFPILCPGYFTSWVRLYARHQSC